MFSSYLCLNACVRKMEVMSHCIRCRWSLGSSNFEFSDLWNATVIIRKNNAVSELYTYVRLMLRLLHTTSVPVHMIHGHLHQLPSLRARGRIPQNLRKRFQQTCDTPRFSSHPLRSSRINDTCKVHRILHPHTSWCWKLQHSFPRFPVCDTLRVFRPSG